MGAPEDVMQFAKDNGNVTGQINTGSMPVQQVIRTAQDELRQLLRQRTEIMKRIGTIKQTIAGLANLFGDEVLGDDLLELIEVGLDQP